MAQVTVNIKLPVDIYQDKGFFIASCARFGVITQGETFEEAKGNIIEAMTLFVETCIEMGTLEKVLRDAGFRPTSNNEKEVDNCPQHIDLSFPFIAHNHLRECHA